MELSNAPQFFFFLYNSTDTLYPTRFVFLIYFPSSFYIFDLRNHFVYTNLRKCFRQGWSYGFIEKEVFISLLDSSDRRRLKSVLLYIDVIIESVRQ
jgi:hypothetical protein